MTEYGSLLPNFKLDKEDDWCGSCGQLKSSNAITLKGLALPIESKHTKVETYQ